MAVEDSIEETIPIVTIHSPPGELPSSPATFLCRSSSLVQLSKDSPNIRVFQTSDAKTLSRFFSISTNALHNQPTALDKLNSTHRFSRSEINLNSHVKIISPVKEDLDYD